MARCSYSAGFPENFFVRVRTSLVSNATFSPAFEINRVPRSAIPPCTPCRSPTATMTDSEEKKKKAAPPAQPEPPKLKPKMFIAPLLLLTTRAFLLALSQRLAVCQQLRLVVLLLRD